MGAIWGRAVSGIVCQVSWIGKKEISVTFWFSEKEDWRETEEVGTDCAIGTGDKFWIEESVCIFAFGNAIGFVVFWSSKAIDFYYLSIVSSNNISRFSVVIDRV
jgi:hypothetical protein